MNTYKTDQEAFWAGEFGDAYVARNEGAQWIANNLALFSRILARTGKIGSVIEFGANIGLNLQALRHLLPAAELAAIEINAQAVAELSKMPRLTVHHGSILDFRTDQPADFALIKGVLIHINPDKLTEVYDSLHAASRCYLCLAEYYNPQPVAIPYRGHADRLFKRDFAGEMLRRFSDLRLVDYGFVYHGDPHFPQDDITWFLMEKTSV